MLPNGCELDRFDVAETAGRAWRAANGIADDACLLLYPGTLGMVNDVDWLAEFVLAAVGEFDNFVFVSIGEGREKDAFVEALTDAGVPADRAMVLAPAPKSQMPSIFSAADLVISTVKPIEELEANSANKFFDGLASGTPVLINHGGWQQRTLEDAGAGGRLPRPMPEAMAALRPWAVDAEARACAGHRARELAAAQFDREKLADRLEALLAETVQCSMRFAHLD